jgi:hypothetical protein
MTVRSLALRFMIGLSLATTACVPPDTQDALQSQRDEATVEAHDTFDRQNAVATESKFISDAMFSPAAEVRFKH